MGHHFNTSKYFWWWEQTSFYSIHMVLFLLNPAWSCFLFLSVRSHSAAPGVHVLCLSLSPPLCFSLSFFSLVDLLLWLWPDDAGFQHLMGWESSSFLCLWDHDVISYFGFFHRPDASGGCGKNASSTFQMFSGQLENHTWIVWLGNIAGLCRRWQWERSWKHSSYAALLSGVSQRVVGVLSDCTAYSGLELGRWKIFLPALHSLSSISSSSFSFWVKHKILLISCKANAVLFVQCLRVISAVED